MDTKVKVETSGPMFNGLAVRMLGRAEDEIKENVARRADDLVDQRLHTVLRNPTGRYQRTVHVVHQSDPYVEGEGTIYGRWLEGESSRNATTRFKGYHTFRTVSQQVDKEAGGIADRHLDRYTRMM